MEKFKHAAERLDEEGIDFYTARNGKQFIVDPRGHNLAFWPGSGKVYAHGKNQAPTRNLLGVEEVIRYIKGARK